VFVGGCHPGDWHYQSGNHRFQKRYVLLRNMVEAMGIGPERLHLIWVSASEGQKFADEITGFTSRIAELGPLKSSTNHDLRFPESPGAEHEDPA
jgi:F420-non-reducing hydrogenase iron-sulfur subunit